MIFFATCTTVCTAGHSHHKQAACTFWAISLGWQSPPNLSPSFVNLLVDLWAQIQGLKDILLHLFIVLDILHKHRVYHMLSRAHKSRNRDRGPHISCPTSCPHTPLECIEEGFRVVLCCHFVYADGKTPSQFSTQHTSCPWVHSLSHLVS